MILVDTSVWIDYFNGSVTWQTDLLHELLRQQPVLTGDLILTEILQGFKIETDFLRAMSLLSGLPYMDMLGRDIAIESARNYRLLRQKGLTVRRTIDVMIATFCVHYRFSLLHSDRDFDSMEDLLSLKIIKADYFKTE